MKFLKSYTGAMVVMVVVIALSVLLGSHRSLTAARSQVEELFYTGADGSGQSIATDLEQRRAVAANLESVALRYLTEADTADVHNARQELERADSPREMYQWDQALGQAADVLMEKLEGCALTEKDAAYLAGFRADLAAKADTMARDPYNERVDQFNREVLGRFPANLLGQLTCVREAEAFRDGTE